MIEIDKFFNVFIKFPFAFKHLIVNIILLGPFYYLALYVFDRDNFMNCPKEIPIIVSFCSILVIHVIYYFIITLFLFSIDKKYKNGIQKIVENLKVDKIFVYPEFLQFSIMTLVTAICMIIGYYKFFKFVDFLTYVFWLTVGILFLAIICNIKYKKNNS